MGYVDAIKELAAQVGMQVPESARGRREEAAAGARADLDAVMEQGDELLPRSSRKRRARSTT